MNAKEGNKLIVEFMGVEPTESCGYFCYYDAPFFYLREKDYNKALNSVIGYVKYHSSWDWLMPVVKKIDETCGIDLHEWDGAINDALCSKEINILWKEVVAFINWYNKNK